MHLEAGDVQQRGVHIGYSGNEMICLVSGRSLPKNYYLASMVWGKQWSENQVVCHYDNMTVVERL